MILNHILIWVFQGVDNWWRNITLLTVRLKLLITQWICILLINFSPCSYWQSRWDFRQIDGGRRWRGSVGPGEFTRTCGLPCGLLSILRLIEAGDRRNQKMCRSITIDRSHKWFFLRTELNWTRERPNLFRPIKSYKWHIRSLMEVLLWERNDRESSLLKRFCDSSIQ